MFLGASLPSSIDFSCFPVRNRHHVLGSNLMGRHLTILKIMALALIFMGGFGATVWANQSDPAVGWYNNDPSRLPQIFVDPKIREAYPNIDGALAILKFTLNNDSYWQDAKWNRNVNIDELRRSVSVLLDDPSVRLVWNPTQTPIEHLVGGKSAGAETLDGHVVQFNGIVFWSPEGLRPPAEVASTIMHELTHVWDNREHSAFNRQTRDGLSGSGLAYDFESLMPTRAFTPSALQEVNHVVDENRQGGSGGSAGAGGGSGGDAGGSTAVGGGRGGGASGGQGSGGGSQGGTGAGSGGDQGGSGGSVGTGEGSGGAAGSGSGGSGAGGGQGGGGNGQGGAGAGSGGNQGGGENTNIDIGAIMLRDRIERELKKLEDEASSLPTVEQSRLHTLKQLRTLYNAALDSLESDLKSEGKKDEKLVQLTKLLLAVADHCEQEKKDILRELYKVMAGAKMAKCDSVASWSRVSTLYKIVQNKVLAQVESYEAMAIAYGDAQSGIADMHARYKKISDKLHSSSFDFDEKLGAIKTLTNVLVGQWDGLIDALRGGSAQAESLRKEVDKLEKKPGTWAKDVAAFRARLSELTGAFSTRIQKAKDERVAELQSFEALDKIYALHKSLINMGKASPSNYVDNAFEAMRKDVNISINEYNWTYSALAELLLQCPLKPQPKVN